MTEHGHVCLVVTTPRQSSGYDLGVNIGGESPSWFDRLRLSLQRDWLELEETFQADRDEAHRNAHEDLRERLAEYRRDTFPETL